MRTVQYLKTCQMLSKTFMTVRTMNLIEYYIATEPQLNTYRRISQSARYRPEEARGRPQDARRNVRCCPKHLRQSE